MRTLSGNLTGRAARLDRADRLEAAIDDAIAEEKRRAAEFRARWDEAVRELLKLDPDGFDAWWDSYPPALTKREFLPIIEERIRFLRSSADHSFRAVMEKRADEIAAALKSDDLPIDERESLWQELTEIVVWLQKDDQAISDYADARLCARFGDAL